MARSIEAHIQAVKTRHKATEEILRHEQTRPQPRTEWLRSLKRDKLRLKDELTRLERQATLP